MPKKKSLFKKSLLIYTIVLIILSFIFLIFVYSNLKKYEKNLLENLLENTIHNLDENQLKKYLSDANQNENYLKTYQDMVKSNDLEFTKIKENVYDVSLNERVLFTINLKSLGEESCLGLLQYEKYEIENIIPHLEKGLIYYTIKIPSNYKLFIDEEIYNEYTKEEKITDLDFMYYEDAMPKILTYEVNNLSKEAKIEIVNYIGEKVDIQKDGVIYTVNYSIKKDNIEDASKIIGNIDIMKIAKDWSLFLSQDLQGGTYGFTTIKNYVIETTPMYNMAYNWAHSVDITFTSKHTLKNPPFSNEKINNFVIYGPNAFSCEVYLEKNMIVSGKEQTDIMHDNLSFIKVNNDWKLMNIKGI